MPNYYYHDSRVIRPGDPVAFKYMCPGCKREFWSTITRKSGKTDTNYLCPECRDRIKESNA